jgi:cytochrome c553
MSVRWLLPLAFVAFSAAAAGGSSACKACHGPDGISLSPVIPNLAGQKGPYIELQLKAFRAGTRKNDLMHAIAGQLSDADIKAYAAFWSSRSTATVETHAAGPAIPSRMSFPANFPTGFTRYQDLPGEDGNGPTRRFANAVAVKALKAGQPLPDGSVIVTENHAADGSVSGYAAMEIRKGWGDGVPALLRNGDWDYAIMGADKQNKPINQAQCLACHKPIVADSYVFTLKDLAVAH